MTDYVLARPATSARSMATGRPGFRRRLLGRDRQPQL